MRTSTSSDLSAGNNRWFFCCMRHSIELWMRNWVSSAYRTISPSLNQYSEIFSFFLESRETVEIEKRCIWPWFFKRKKALEATAVAEATKYLLKLVSHTPSFTPRVCIAKWSRRVTFARLNLSLNHHDWIASYLLRWAPVLRSVNDRKTFPFLSQRKQFVQHSGTMTAISFSKQTSHSFAYTAQCFRSSQVYLKACFWCRNTQTPRIRRLKAVLSFSCLTGQMIWALSFPCSTTWGSSIAFSITDKHILNSSLLKEVMTWGRRCRSGKLLQCCALGKSTRLIT